MSNTAMLCRLAVISLCKKGGAYFGRFGVARLRHAKRGLGAIFAILLSATAAIAQASPGQGAVFTFIDNAVVLKPGASGGDGILTIHLTSNPQQLPPKVFEFGAEPATVTWDAPMALGDPGAGDWAIHIKISHLDKMVAPLTRHLQVAVNGASESRTYTITNAYAGTFSWNVVSLVSTLSWSVDRPIAAMVTVGPVPATNVVANAVLTDDATAVAFGAADMQVCMNRTGQCQRATGLAANQTYRLFLRPPADVQPMPGKYTGAITLISSEDKSAASQVTVHVTDSAHKALGVVSILVGVLLSFAVTIGVRNQLARKQLLAPAAELRDSFSAFAVRLAGLRCQGVAADNTTRCAREWKERLGDASLTRKSYVPGVFAIAAPVAAAGQPYQKLLDNAGAWTAVLSRIIDNGLDPLSKLDLSQITAPAKQKTAADAISAAWRNIDAQAKTLGERLAAATPDQPAAPALEALDSTISVEVRKAQAAYDGALGLVSDVAPVRRTASQRLQFQIAVLSSATWAIAALFTVLVGSYVLVISNLDFGRVSDLWLCFFWGVGLPTAGSQLSQATPSSLAGSLGVNVVKPSQ